MAESESARKRGNNNAGNRAGGQAAFVPPPGERHRLAQLAMGALAVGVLFMMILVIVAPTFYRAQLHVSEADVLQTDLLSPVTMSLRSPMELANKKRQVQQNSPHLFRIERRGEEMTNRLFDLLDEAVTLAADAPAGGEESARIVYWRENTKTGLGDLLEDGAVQLAMTHGDDESLRSVLRARLIDLLDRRGVASNLTNIENSAVAGNAYLLARDDQPLDEAAELGLARVRDMVEMSNRQSVLRAALGAARLPHPTVAMVDLLDPFVVENVIPLQSRADEIRAMRVEAVEIEPMEWRVGDVLLDAGTLIGRDELDFIAAANAQIQRLNFLRLAFFGGLVGAMVIFAGYYIGKFQPEIPRSAIGVAIAGSPIVIPLLLGRLLLMFFGESSGAAYAFPAALVGTLSVILVEPRYALHMVMGASLLFGFATGIDSEQSFSTMIVSVAGGFAAVMSLFVLRKRSDIFLAGLQAGIVSAVSVLGVEVLAGDPNAYSALAGLAGGIASGVLTYPILDLMERITGITTDVGLMELTSIRHPLIEQLEEKAPGTYQHTLNVTKLAEAAAVAIGANYLLVRAGCMFHDIGKMDKPKYFSENQVSPEDRRAHDKLTPQMSALIIKEHVRNGVLKAREHRLPGRVVDFITEHHGTTTIAYFYRKALKLYEESESNDPVRPEMFQYGGPSPQTRETAIALLADSVDAVSMAKLNGPSVTRDEIKRLVRDVINQKFREEQFDECNLTLRDLSKIQDAFVRALEARFHHRVKYPEAPTKRRAQQSANDVKSRTSGGGSPDEAGSSVRTERASGERSAVGGDRSISGDNHRATDGPSQQGATITAGYSKGGSAISARGGEKSRAGTRKKNGGEG